MHAIVLDGDLKSALGAIRSLGRRGISVSVGAERKTAIGHHSRYASRTFVYPSPYTHRSEFIQALKNEARALPGTPAVLAMSDATFLTLYAHREELTPFVTLMFPPDESMEIAFNKAATFSFARVRGVPAITTYLPETKEDLDRLIPSLTFPVVVKPRRSVTWRESGGIFGSASFVHVPLELHTKFERMKTAAGEPPLIQPFVRGEEYGVEMLVREGVPYARVTHHRIRSLSPTGGASVLKETLFEGELTRTLEEHAEKLARELTWTGPLMAEFKVEEGTRQAYLMELNGRFWGSLPLSVAAGVDMPVLFYESLQGAFPPNLLSGREGVMTRHFWGDVAHLMKALFKRDPMRRYLYPSRRKALSDFFSWHAGSRGDIWSLSDPKPAMMEPIDIIARSWK